MELWERGAVAAPSATPWSSFIWSVFYVFVRLALYLLILFFPCFACWLSAFVQVVHWKDSVAK